MLLFPLFLSHWLTHILVARLATKRYTVYHHSLGFTLWIFHWTVNTNFCFSSWFFNECSYTFSTFCPAFSGPTTPVPVLFIKPMWKNVINFRDQNIESVKVCVLNNNLICIFGGFSKNKSWCRMKPMLTNKRMLIWLCMCSPNSRDPLLKKVYHIAFASMVFIFNLWVVAAHLAYFWTFRSTHLDESLFALTNATAFSVVMYSMIYAFFTRHQTRRIFKNLWKIYSARAYNIYNEFGCESGLNRNLFSFRFR